MESGPAGLAERSRPPDGGLRVPFVAESLVSLLRFLLGMECSQAICVPIAPSFL